MLVYESTMLYFFAKLLLIIKLWINYDSKIGFNVLYCMGRKELQISYWISWIFRDLPINILAFSIVVKWKNTLKCLSQFCKCYQNFFHGLNFIWVSDMQRLNSFSNSPVWIHLHVSRNELQHFWVKMQLSLT